MKVGITATRKGITQRQRVRLIRDLAWLKATELHHGDCIGGDADVHKIAISLGLRVVVHPPSDPKLRAFCQGDEIREPKPYLERNHDIVDETDVTIGLPETTTEVWRGSGTWATIRYAKRLGKARVINPEGDVT